jgi:hypothetical protein
MQLIARMTRNGHGTALDRVPIVAVAAGLAHLPPAIPLDELDDVADLHGQRQ